MSHATAGHGDGSVARVTTPLYLLLFPVPIVCFLLALLTDFRYEASAFLMWLHFSEWLIATGLAVGVLAALALLVAFLARSAIRASVGWLHLLLFYAALVVELVNAFVHSIDGWTAVVWTGMALSIIGSVLALGAAGTLLAGRNAWATRREVRP